MSYTINNISVGIPAGTIFASAAYTADPSGYVIADGIERTNGADGRYNNLIDLTIGLGTLTKNAASYTPINLKAAFLRSAESQTITPNSYTGPAIKTYQNSSTEKHSHTSSSYPHSHTTNSTAGPDYNNTNSNVGVGIVDGTNTETGENSHQDNEGNVFDLYGVTFINADPQTGYTTLDGDDDNETAPFCYGVNWLIKL